MCMWPRGLGSRRGSRENLQPPATQVRPWESLCLIGGGAAPMGVTERHEPFFPPELLCLPSPLFSQWSQAESPLLPLSPSTDMPLVCHLVSCYTLEMPITQPVCLVAMDQPSVQPAPALPRAVTRNPPVVLLTATWAALGTSTLTGSHHPQPRTLYDSLLHSALPPHGLLSQEHQTSWL